MGNRRRQPREEGEIMAEFTLRPIDIREVDIGSDLAELNEKLAENAH